MAFEQCETRSSLHRFTKPRRSSSRPASMCSASSPSRGPAAGCGGARPDHPARPLPREGARAAGLVERVAERRVRAIAEGVYQAAARSYWLLPRSSSASAAPARAAEPAATSTFSAWPRSFRPTSATSTRPRRRSASRSAGRPARRPPGGVPRRGAGRDHRSRRALRRRGRRRAHHLSPPHRLLPPSLLPKEMHHDPDHRPSDHPRRRRDRRARGSRPPRADRGARPLAGRLRRRPPRCRRVRLLGPARLRGPGPRSRPAHAPRA